MYTNEDHDANIAAVVTFENNKFAEIKSGLNEGDTVYYTESNSGGMFGGMFGGNFDSGRGGNKSDFGGGRGESMPQIPEGVDISGFGG